MLHFDVPPGLSAVMTLHYPRCSITACRKGPLRPPLCNFQLAMRMRVYLSQSIFATEKGIEPNNRHSYDSLLRSGHIEPYSVYDTDASLSKPIGLCHGEETEASSRNFYGSPSQMGRFTPLVTRLSGEITRQAVRY